MVKKRYFKTKEECEVTFEFDGDATETVSLVSEVNGWQPVEMKKRKKDGVFYTKVRLPKTGDFQFRYLVDGQSWANDSAADAYVRNEFGSENSVVKTTLSKSKGGSICWATSSTRGSKYRRPVEERAPVGTAKYRCRKAGGRFCLRRRSS